MSPKSEAISNSDANSGEAGRLICQVSGSDPSLKWPSIQERYRNYLLAVLIVVLAFNCGDRLALGFVLQDIKVDLHLSDTQLGVLTGIAFAAFYSVMGIPIARWSDTGNRVAIMTLTTTLWGVTVALCGVVGGFAQLLLMRMAVGVGEAGCMPLAHSLIADYFARAERPRAVATYMQGVSLSVVIGYFAAGWLTQLFGWRAMFMIMGLPGLALAILAGCTLREPRRREPRSSGSATSGPSLKEVWAALWENVTFRHLVCAAAVMNFFSCGILQWTPAFFIRSFEVKSGVLGNWLAVTNGASCALGTYWGGRWAARRAAGNERLQVKAAVVAICISGLFGAFVYVPAVAPNAYWAFGWLAISMFFSTAINGPLLAVIQTLVPGRMRATAISLLYLFTNLIGLGLGPLVAGALSDELRVWFAEESLRMALLVLWLGTPWVGWHLWRASKTVACDLERAATP